MPKASVLDTGIANTTIKQSMVIMLMGFMMRFIVISPVYKYRINYTPHFPGINANQKGEKISDSFNIKKWIFFLCTQINKSTFSN